MHEDCHESENGTGDAVIRPAGAIMTRPAFLFYPGDWLRNKNLARCTLEEKAVWLHVMCLMHDSEEYGVLRWTLKELATAVHCKVSHLKALLDKGVMKGAAAAGEVCRAYVYTPRSGRRNGPPVTLVAEQPGPIWYSSRMVRDAYVRRTSGAATRFGAGKSDTPPDTLPDDFESPEASPTRRHGERQDDSPTRRHGERQGEGQGDGLAVAVAFAVNQNLKTNPHSGGSGTPRVRACETPQPPPQANETKNPANPPTAPPPHVVDGCLTPVGVSVALVGWERERGKPPRGVTASSPHVIDLAAMRVSADELRRAYDLAVADRQASGDASPISAGFLRVFIDKVRAPPRPKADDWHRTDAGIDRKANELGVRPRPGETYAALKDRVFEAVRRRDQPGAAA
ncbi:hypothetical protein [Paraburkholderia sp. BR14320]|uniref:hypothetical protein n=1 Tax=unclassified Paraburkholderia TaxID=2615204 RepID=UPI0034CFBB5E